MEWMYAVGGETEEWMEWMYAVPPEGMGLNLLARENRYPAHTKPWAMGTNVQGPFTAAWSWICWVVQTRNVPFPYRPSKGENWNLSWSIGLAADRGSHGTEMLQAGKAGILCLFPCLCPVVGSQSFLRLGIAT